MDDVTTVLKEAVDERGVGMDGGVFDLLLSAACSECCDANRGGNGTCPPPPKLAAGADAA
jgi:hypothetical protein